MKTYKGFNPDLTCRGFQYEVGKTYEQDGEIAVCQKGFHACENPLDVLCYYPPASDKGETRYCETESDGVIDKSESDKTCSSRIHIRAEIGLRGLIEAGVKFILDRVKWKDAKESNTGYRSAATNTGYQSAATNTGYQSAATNTGDRSAATNTGDQSAATNTGYRSAATAGGADSVAIVTGRDSRAKGSLGNWLVLTERDENWHILGVQAVKVDGDAIRPDIWYWLKGGEVKEYK